MNVEIFRHGRCVIPYKYVVFSRRNEETLNPCEYLHGAPQCNQDTSRVLEVPHDKCNPGGRYSHVLQFAVITNNW